MAMRFLESGENTGRKDDTPCCSSQSPIIMDEGSGILRVTGIHTFFIADSFEAEERDWGFVGYGGKDDSPSTVKKEKKDEGSLLEATKSFWYTGKLSLMSSFYNLYQRCMC